VQAALDYLQAQPYVRPGGVRIMGFCMGGRVSYLMAATNAAIRAAADFYGGGVHKGEGGPSPLELTGNIRCPVIIFDGEEDQHPSPDEVRQTEAELKRHGVPHEVHIYPGVGHGFMGAEPTGAGRKSSMTPGPACSPGSSATWHRNRSGRECRPTSCARLKDSFRAQQRRAGILPEAQVRRAPPLSGALPDF
jgi:dienelactone hydrolase